MDTLLKCAIVIAVVIAVYSIFLKEKKRAKESTLQIENRVWHGITLEDIDRQWAISINVHPSFGRQISHFSAGLDQTLRERNLS